MTRGDKILNRKIRFESLDTFFLDNESIEQMFRLQLLTKEKHLTKAYYLDDTTRLV
jgi:hypothetical protein